MTTELNDALGILIAILGGAAVGVERQWSGHASGPKARFAGIRTFTLLGLAAGIAGLLWADGQHALATIILAGCVALIVVAYAAASRVEVDGTTEVAALVVLAAGTLSGMHHLKLASAAMALTTLLLIEKSRLHNLVARIDDASLHAAVRFTVMALVILPLLPSGPYGPWGGIRPRQLWALVLFFSGLSFVGYLSHRLISARRGYTIAGMLGGIISSTNVTFAFARTSRSEAASGTALAIGAIAASAVMCIRVLVATAVLNPAASVSLARYLIAPFLTAAAIGVVGSFKGEQSESRETLPSNPLQFTSALQMAVLFQLVIFGVRWAEGKFGQPGVFVSAGLLGFTDVDALVISIAKNAAAQLSSSTIAQAITIGVLANTILKLGIAVVVGSGRFRSLVGAGLCAVAVACAVSIWVALM